MQSRAHICVALKYQSTLSYAEVIQERDMLLQGILIDGRMDPQGKLRRPSWEHYTTMFPKTEATRCKGLGDAEIHTPLRQKTDT